MAAGAIVMAAAAAPAQAPPRAAGAAGAEYRVDLDPWARPEMGVVGLTTAGRLALAGFDVLAATWEGRCAEPSLWCGAARAFELVLIDLPVAHYAQVLPHELLGTGGERASSGSRCRTSWVCRCLTRLSSGRSITGPSGASGAGQSRSMN